MWESDVLELAYVGQGSWVSNKPRTNSTWVVMNKASVNISSICLG